MLSKSLMIHVKAMKRKFQFRDKQLSCEINQESNRCEEEILNGRNETLITFKSQYL